MNSMAGDVHFIIIFEVHMISMPFSRAPLLLFRPEFENDAA